MTFVRRASRTIAWALGLSLPLAALAAFLPSGVVSDAAADRVVRVLGWVIGVAAGAALALPVAGLLLVRLRLQHDVVDRSWGRTAIVAAILLAAVGVYSFRETVLIWKAPGLGLAAFGLIGVIGTLLTRTVPGPARHFYVTAVGVLVTLCATTLVPYVSGSRGREVETAVRNDVRVAISEVALFNMDDARGLPVPTGSPGISVNRLRDGQGWLIVATHDSTGVRCRSYVPDGAGDAPLDCAGGSASRGNLLASRMGIAYSAGVLLLLGAGLVLRRGNSMRSGKPSSFRIITSARPTKRGSKS